jgi:xanthine dehydrogenase YagT iron-sulfur-binding subunit
LSSKLDHKKKKPKSNFSRRGFLKGVSITSGALNTGILKTEAEAQTAAAVAGPGLIPITFIIHGRARKVMVEPRFALLDTLRNRLDLTAAKRVCDRGTCGACTVIIDGKVLCSCLVLAIDAPGKQILTLEGLSQSGKPHPVSQAWTNNDAQQCGYCTPGFVVAATGLLDRKPEPNRGRSQKRAR